MNLWKKGTELHKSAQLVHHYSLKLESLRISFMIRPLSLKKAKNKIET